MPDPTKPFAYRFLRPKDNAYWQTGDPDIVWQVTRNNLIDNERNYFFILETARSSASSTLLLTGLLTLANHF
jgi:hypothetical protein